MSKERAAAKNEVLADMSLDEMIVENTDAGNKNMNAGNENVSVGNGNVTAPDKSVKTEPDKTDTGIKRKHFWRDSMRKGMPAFLALAGVVLLVFFIWQYDSLVKTVNNILNVFFPIIVGGILAYLLKTPVNFFERIFTKVFPKKMKKSAPALALVVTFVIALVLLYLFFALIIPELINSVVALANAIPRSFENFQTWLENLNNADDQFSTILISIITGIEVNAVNWMNDSLLPTLQGMAGEFAVTIGAVFGALINFLIGIFVCIYFLAGRKTFSSQAKAFMYASMKKEKVDKVLTEVKWIDKTFVGYFGGKVIEAVVMGVLCYIFCFILQLTLGFKNAVLVSIIIGVTNLIPYFGAYIGVGVCALIILIDSPVNCLIFVVFFIVLQQVDGNIIGPKLLAGSVGLNGFWVLFSIVVFGGFFGLPGLLFGVPVFAVFYDFVRRWLHNSLKKKGLRTDGTPIEPEENAEAGTG